MEDGGKQDYDLILFVFFFSFVSLFVHEVFLLFFLSALCVCVGCVFVLLVLLYANVSRA